MAGDEFIWRNVNLTAPTEGSFFCLQHEYVNTSEVWAFTGRFNEFDDYEVFYKPITELTPPINFDYQTFPDEDGFILGNNVTNRYFLVDLKGNTEYFIFLTHNKSFNEEGTEIFGGSYVKLYNSTQIDDHDHDGITEGIGQ